MASENKIFRRTRKKSDYVAGTTVKVDLVDPLKEVHGKKVSKPKGKKRHLSLENALIQAQAEDKKRRVLGLIRAAGYGGNKFKKIIEYLSNVGDNYLLSTSEEDIYFRIVNEIFNAKEARSTAPENLDFKTEDKKHIREAFVATSDPVEIGASLKAMRLASGKTQLEVAKAMDIPKSAIGRLEQGKHSPKADTLEKYANAVGYVFKPHFEPL